jgi:sulfonate transport system permease protein
MRSLDVRRILVTRSRLRARSVGEPLRTRAEALTLGSIPPLIVLVLWIAAVRWHMMRPQILPSPLVVWQTGHDLLAGGDLAQALAISLLRVLQGLAIGGACGVLLGGLLGRSRGIDAYLGPMLRAICGVPTIAWLPCFMLLFGIGEPLKIVLIAKASFLPLFLNTYTGMRTVPVPYLEVARVLELSFAQRLRLVLIPAALPFMVGGLRLALGNAWKALVVVEMVASAAGIGHLMAWGRTLFQLDVVVVTIVAIGATGWIMDGAMRAMERRLSPARRGR